MSKEELLKNINSKYILIKIFSFIPSYNCLKLIKYNKYLQNKTDINFKDSILNYQYIIKTKSEIISEIEKMEDQLKSEPQFKNELSILSFASKFCVKYSYNFPENINENEEEIMFLIKHKGFKINDYPLPSIFMTFSYKERITYIEKNEYFFKYSLKDENVELIRLINEFREQNNLKRLIFNKLQNLKDFFKDRNLFKEKFLFEYPIGEFKKLFEEKKENIIEILINENLNNILILEKDNKEYIFIYSCCEDKNNTNFIIKVDEDVQTEKFHIINNTYPEINLDDYLLDRGLMAKNLIDSIGNNNPGYQILKFNSDTLIGLLEGPPDTPYENGYFLFKIIFSKNYPFSSPQFIFITSIFHPNISENGYVSIDILSGDWTFALLAIIKIIYSVQSLLDDPNPDYFLNETAAKLYKSDKNIYNETIRKYTSLYAKYSKFLEYAKNMNIKIKKYEKNTKFNFKK